jgi:putative membrane protein
MNEEREQRSQSEPEPAQSGEPVADLRIPAALVRTALSSEQTLMSWIRTSLSLYAFGFSITQFFFYLEQHQPASSELSAGPRRLGIALISLGILALVSAIVEHLVRLERMKAVGLPNASRYFLPVGSGLAVLAIGITALIAVTMKWSL